MGDLFPATVVDLGYQSRLSLQPRPYQQEAVDSAFEQFDSGITGTLIRAATGSGKTAMACMLFDRWLARGDDYRCMVLSYERELVWQFAQEIEDFLGIVPGIEMSNVAVDEIPLITVASRQTLARRPLATQEQRELLADEYGITELGLLTMVTATSIIKSLQSGMEIQQALDAISEFNERPECSESAAGFSRVHKFDPHYNWLVCFDEAHKYSMGLKQTGHLVEWFERNPNSRRVGLTGTPKRFDGVSIGSRLFPGIALDYPLSSAVGRSALSEGYAVPYLQKYISVEGIDFQQLKKVAGDFDDHELETILSEEETLATLVEPLLDLVGDRKTLIFSPGVNMAKLVAAYINARCECICDCGKQQWVARPLIGDGATCKQCDATLRDDQITKRDNQAVYVYGAMPHNARQEVYRQHKEGAVQFLSVCGLCREGYNDPGISCVAVFRPVSKAASSLAEQMKGRGCRPARGLVEGVPTAEERKQLISNSETPDCLIVDLVGITGLGDCATTAQIYADGQDDEVIARADEILLEGGVPNVDEAIKQAVADVEASREEARLAREEQERQLKEAAERRSRTAARARYSESDIGYGENVGGRLPDSCSDAQLKYLHFLGMSIVGWIPSKRQAGRMIDMLVHGESLDHVAYYNGIRKEHWVKAPPSVSQVKCLARYGVNCQGLTPKQASDLIDRAKNGEPISSNAGKLRIWEDKIDGCMNDSHLDDVGREIAAARRAGEISDEDFQALVIVGKNKRGSLFR